MVKALLNLSIFSLLIFLNSCAQDPKTELNGNTQESSEVSDHDEDRDDESPYTEAHQFGGWYCPDNFGFKPVDISDLSTVPVVQGRMPTKEEVQNGSALMYVSPKKFPNAKALEIELPALAHVKMPYSDQKELAIVIQAFVADTDTIVGYRFPNGGNGSQWIQNVDFLSDEEVKTAEATPFFYEEIEVSATKAAVWKAFTKTDLAKDLGKKSKNKALYTTDWSENLNVDFSYEHNGESVKGYAASMFGNLYIHIDYFQDGQHSSKKLLVTQDPITYKSTIMLASGPYLEDFQGQEQFWNEWLMDLKTASEK
ncbi:MAG: hypothetical protein Crog4KO_13880 [Crocinitomicaceae bacterium]